MSILQFKTLAIILLATAGLIGGQIPLKVSLSKKGQRLMTLGNAFAGGIFLGAGIIHMLGDAVELFGSIANGSDYPWAFLICGCGFLGILMIEKVCVKCDEPDISTDGNPVYPYVLLLVLSVHSVIAGMSLGLEKTMTTTVVIFIALIAHKGSAAFALGVGLRNLGVATVKHMKLVALFACMTPLGVCLGTIFTKLATAGTIIKFEAVFDALAAGTFLYVAIMDIIAESYEDRVDSCWKFLCVSAGFGLMAVIAIWT